MSASGPKTDIQSVTWQVGSFAVVDRSLKPAPPGLGLRGSIAYTRPTGGTFHCLVQFTATLDPSEMTSLLLRGFPGQRSELTEGYRSFGVFRIFIQDEPRSVLFPIFCPEARPSHGDKNIRTQNFYPQVRVDHFSSPRRPTPNLRCQPNGENFSSIASFAWRKMVFSTVAICDQFVERNVFSRRAGRDNRHTKSSMTEFLC